MFDRVDAKMRARASMKGAYPHPMLVTLVYVLLTTGVALLVNLLSSGGTLTQLMLYLEYVEDPEILLAYYLPAILRSMAASSVISILLSLYQSVVGFGYYSYGLRLARNEQPGYRNLFDGFARFGRVLLMMFLIGLLTSLWTLLGMVPYFVLLILGIALDSGIIIFLAALAAIAGVVFGVYMGLRYEMAPFVLIDQPDHTALEAIGESTRMMKGNVWSLFVLQLSFFGWALLSVLTLGILSLWLDPYMVATTANFYDWVSRGWTGGTGEAQNHGPEIQF